MNLNLVHLVATISPGRRDHHGIGLLGLHHSVKRDRNVTTSRELRGLIRLVSLGMLQEIISALLWLDLTSGKLVWCWLEAPRIVATALWVNSRLRLELCLRHMRLTCQRLVELQLLHVLLVLELPA